MNVVQMSASPKRPGLKLGGGGGRVRDGSGGCGRMDVDGKMSPLEGNTRVGGGLACSVDLIGWPFSLFLQFQNESSDS